MNRIDLHTHSCCSDGSCTPTELVELAAAAGVGAIALTDHDTVAGIPEFLEAGRRHPEVETVPGVELSTMFSNRELHMVGLFIDPETPVLTAFLEEMREGRRCRNEQIRLKLNTLGFPVTWDDPAFAGASSDSASIGRPHFARALMHKYGFPTMQSVFDRLLKRGCAAYVPRELPDPARAIEVIHAAGGIAVWAHPVYRERNERAWAKRIMRRFSPLGLDAVEGYYSMFGPQETALVLELAGLYHLAVSGGSDFHGANSPNIQLGSGAGGLLVPPELLNGLKARCVARRAAVDKPGLP